VAFVPRKIRSKNRFQYAQLLQQRLYPRVQRFTGKVAWEALALQQGDPEACFGAGDGGRRTARPTADYHDVEEGKHHSCRQSEHGDGTPAKRAVLPP
jgi:hypothetical protein